MSISDSQLDVAQPLGERPMGSPLALPVEHSASPPLPPRRPNPRDAERSGVETAPAIRRGAPVPPPVLPPPVPSVSPTIPPQASPATSVTVTPTSTTAVEPQGIPREAAIEEKERKRPFWAWLISMPSWLASAIVHLVALLVLALLTIPLDESKPPPILLVAGLDHETEELIVSATVQLDTKLENLNVSTSGIDSEELESADMGESLQNLPRPDNSVAMATVEATWDDLGNLFGNKGSGLKPTGASGQGAEFFGVKAGGRKFVFIVDSSNSMKRGKFDAARKELEYAIRRLDGNQFFYVIFFDHDAARMTFAPNKEPEERAARATMKNIQLAEKWMGGIENELRTDPYDAVKYAVEMLPDAIYILSDGKFTDKGRTERYLANFNKLSDPIDGPRPKVVIHTVGFYNRDGEECLQRIAKEYGGTYRFVPAPPGFKGKK